MRPPGSSRPGFTAGGPRADWLAGRGRRERRGAGVQGRCGTFPFRALTLPAGKRGQSASRL